MERQRKVLHKEINEVYTPCGCSECINGYSGRIALHEVLEINQNIRDAITNNVKKSELRHLVYKKSDVTSLLEDGLEKVVAGLTSVDEILRVIDVDDDTVHVEPFNDPPFGHVYEGLTFVVPET